ncbi:hypothetical protein V6N13_047182 [Hibiscus sabdariffa]|uniref:NAC domain-containing protein n=1 Tax=Hibiscus sabdariffa TaxID=183260 RepID=A0ABR2F3C6_9ROSI
MNNLKFKGCGFNPSDQLLVDSLRDRTLLGRDYLVQYIIDLDHDICNYDPWDLPGCDSVTPSDSVRFFTYPITYKYPKSSSKIVDPTTGTRTGPDGMREPMINRTTNNGKWKISGGRIKLKDNDSDEVIGIKTRLYFRPNSCPNKTSCVLYQFELTGVDPCQNKYFLGKLMMKEFKPTDIGSSRGETSTRISIPEVRVRVPVEFDPEPLVEIGAPSDYEWTQNQTSEQTTECIASVPVNDGNDVISNLQPSNDVADDAIPHNLQRCLELIRSWLEVPDIGDQSFPNIRIDNDQNVPSENDRTNGDERSNQHNIGAVAANESTNLPSNLHNDLSQINWSVFDDLCWNDGLYAHELFDGAQNQCGTDQQVADERDKSAAGAEIEGYNNLPSLGVTESSEMVGKRSSIDIETESAQPHAKKSRL